MPAPTHLNEGDYAKLFPEAVDEFPTVINEQHYIDAWMLNSIFRSLEATEQYVLDYLTGANQPPGYNIIGADGQYLLPIPPGLYGSYLFALAWDSELLAENIKAGVEIFGVLGTLTSLVILTVMLTTWEIAATGTPYTEVSYA